MGEVIELESYRRRLKRKTARSQGGGNRRNPDRAASRNEASGAKGKAGPGTKARAEKKVESSDPKSE